MLADNIRADEFTGFVAAFELRLRQLLSAAWGAERGREAAAEALAYGWEHWDRISGMSNPEGYLFRVATDRARKAHRQRRFKAFPSPISHRDPWIEPGLDTALEKLPEQQRTVIALVHGYQWSMSEVAAALGVSKSTVQSYEGRGMKSLRRHLKVEQ